MRCQRNLMILISDHEHWLRPDVDSHPAICRPWPAQSINDLILKKERIYSLDHRQMRIRRTSNRSSLNFCEVMFRNSKRLFLDTKTWLPRIQNRIRSAAQYQLTMSLDISSASSWVTPKRCLGGNRRDIRSFNIRI